jgi:hypothetical protein
MKELQEEVLKQCVAIAVKDGRSDLENIFREVMDKRLSFYRTFEENKEMNTINIDTFLKMEAK